MSFTRRAILGFVAGLPFALKQTSELLKPVEDEFAHTNLILRQWDLELSPEKPITARMQFGLTDGQNVFGIPVLVDENLPDGQAWMVGQTLVMAKDVSSALRKA